jgi:hypothetical protein
MNNQIEVPSANRAGQSTQIEQARAMAQVHAMMRMAKEYPRDPALARRRMHDACGQMVLAEKAFFRFPRGGQQVTGPTIHLARELAGCWGNIDFGVSELARDDYKLESEMLAQAWDIETNTRTYAGFILPHKQDVGGGTKPLYTMREIYENNANAGARRLREAIYAVLPIWFCIEAQALCNKTLAEENSSIPLHERIEKLVEWFAAKGIKQDQLRDKIGKPLGHWTAGDVATMRVITQSLIANETTIELEFPTVFTRAEDIAAPVAEVETKPGTPVKTEQWSEIADAEQEPERAPLPPQGYVCDICDAVGEHFQDVCPTLNHSGE